MPLKRILLNLVRQQYPAWVPILYTQEQLEHFKMATERVAAVSEVQGMREELRQAVTTQTELERLSREVAEAKASRGVLGVLEQVRSYVAERVRRKL